MILLLFGPPGCGKGTQAGRLAERYKIPAISTGEMFRAEHQAGTELGRLACDCLTRGALVGDEIVNGIVAQRIAQPDCAGGFLLDGYPRTLPQAEWFTALLRERGLPQATVIHLNVDESLLVARLTARRQCPQCKRIYNLLTLPPRNPGVCDADGVSLITRSDDFESVIRARLRAYREQTGPILEWYGPDAVRTVDGGQAPDEVAVSIARVLEAAAVAR